jgi:CRISPR-associated protein Csb1
MTTLPHEIINSWADDEKGPVALVLKQKLVPVEGEGAVIFPPTYADIGYNIDTLSDGTKVVTIDSVGSQANRMEPIFKREDLKHLVPQIMIRCGTEPPLSILDVGHRLGDAIVRSSKAPPEKDQFDLGAAAKDAFAAYLSGNAEPIAKLAPTSIVFGAWDSRESGAKLPRIVQSTVRAFNASTLHRAALFTPAVDYVKAGILEPTEEKAEKDKRSARGYLHSPATWNTNDKMPEYVNGRANDDRRIPGGVVVQGEITRHVTINLIAIQRLAGGDPTILRRYILGLALVAGTEPPEAFLRQGCILVPDGTVASKWVLVQRSGVREELELTLSEALKYASEAAAAFGVRPKQDLSVDRDSVLIDVEGESQSKAARRKTKGTGADPTKASEQNGVT